MADQKSNLKQTLGKLVDVIGVSGHEQEIIKVVYNEIKDYADEVHISTTGNVVAIKKGAKPGLAVAIAAHMDEVGYVVRNILESGFIILDKIGTAPGIVAVGRKVLIGQKRIPGVIGTKPGHLMTADESTRVPALDRCFVDLGLDSAEEVRALGIKIGDPVVIDSPMTEMSNPDMLCSRAMDDRVGCAVIIDLFKNLKADDFAGTLYGVFNVREEVGMLGAKNAIYDYDIDYLFALDTIPVADTPDYNPKRDLPIYLGKGPGLPILETFALNFNMIHPGLREVVETKAQENQIHLQTMTLAFANYVTDGAAFAYSKSGLPVVTLTIPRRYSHSPVELLNINDAVDVLNLLTAIVKDNENVDLSFVKLD